jgi:hypothetical protein
MRDPILSELRRIRARLSREHAKNKPGQAVAESYALVHEICDVVIDDEGKTHYIANGKKMHDRLMARRIAGEAGSKRHRTPRTHRDR